MRHGCFGLMRLVGSIGFLGFAMACFSLTREGFGVDLQAELVGELSGKGKVLMVISVGAGMIGGLIGQGIGLKIPVRRESTRELIDSFWHFSANSTIHWFLILSIVMGLFLGKETAMALVRERGVWTFSIVMIVIPHILGAVITLSLVVIGKALAHAGHAFSFMFMVRVFPWIAAIGAGIALMRYIGASPLLGVAGGILHAIIVIPISIRMIQEDRLRRETLNRGPGP